MWWKEIMLPKEYNLYVAFRCWVQFVRCITKLLVFSEELCILNDIWIICSMNNAKCVRQSFTAGQSLPPGFCAARECFGAKKLLSARFSCRTPMFLLQRSCYRAYSCRTSSFNEIVYKKNINISKKNEKKNHIPLEWPPVRKNAVQKFSGRSVHAPQSFSLTNRHVTQISI